MHIIYILYIYTIYLNDIAEVHFLVPWVPATICCAPRSATASHLSVLHLASVDGAGATAVGEGVGARAGEGTLRFRKRWEAKKARVIHEHMGMGQYLYIPFLMG